MKPVRITQEIFQVGGTGLSAPGDAAVYLIRIGSEAALVDSGTGQATGKIMENVKKAGAEADEIKYLLLTHCHFDHTGGAKEIKELVGCEAVAHELEAPYLEQADQVVTAAKWYGAMLEPFVIEKKIRGPKEELVLGGKKIQAIHIPGHSPGSMAFVMESEGMKVLFGQDVHGPLDPSLLSNTDLYLQSLRVLISLEADILCEGHYGIIQGRQEVKQFINSFITE